MLTSKIVKQYIMRIILFAASIVQHMLDSYSLNKVSSLTAPNSIVCIRKEKFNDRSLDFQPLFYL